MAYSHKRMKAWVTGKVKYCIFDGDNNLVFFHKSFSVAVSMADRLQKANPGINYTMKLMEVDGNA